MYTYKISGQTVRTSIPLTPAQIEGHKELLFNHKFNTRMDWERYRRYESYNRRLNKNS